MDEETSGRAGGSAGQPSESPRLDRVRHRLNVLRRWLREEPKAVSQAAGEVAPLVWEELQDRGLWARLADHDQAAVHRLLACGHVMASGTNISANTGTFQRHRDTLLREVAYFAALCEPHALRWPEVDRERRAEETQRAVDHLTRFLALPEKWQAAVLDQMQPEREASVTEISTLPTVDEALADAEAHSGEDPPEPWRLPWFTKPSGEDLLRRLRSLPYPGWHTEVFRMLAAGRTPASVTGESQQDINVLTVYGVRLAWVAKYDEEKRASSQ